MDIVKEIARLSERGQSKSEIEKVTGVTRKTVRGYLDKLSKATSTTEIFSFNKKRILDLVYVIPSDTF